jgi:hypothetical protein
VALVLAGAGMCILVLLVAVAGLAGLLDEAPPEPLPAAAVEEVSQGQPWNVTVISAGLFTDLSPAVLEDDSHHWLAVVAVVEVTALESRTDLRDVLYVTGIDGLGGGQFPSRIIGIGGAVAADDVRIARDGSVAISLHPGLAERVGFLWERSGDAPPPAEIEVRIVGKTHRESSLTSTMEWLDPTPRARVTVPLEDRRGEQ